MQAQGEKEIMIFFILDLKLFIQTLGSYSAYHASLNMKE